MPNRLQQAVRQRLVGTRVLLAEDHPLNQQLACELLRRAGVEVVVAKDGREALAKLAGEGPFDGVLMDCQMPVMDGYTATRELRKSPGSGSSLPVIAMTASALAEDRDRALASGMNAHITKPIHIETMLRTMAQWISQAPAGRVPMRKRQRRADVNGTDRGWRRCHRHRRRAVVLHGQRGALPAPARGIPPERSRLRRRRRRRRHRTSLE